MIKKSPQFLYWLTVLDLELICLMLVRSFREANFSIPQCYTTDLTVDVCYGSSKLCQMARCPLQVNVCSIIHAPKRVQAVC